MDIITPAERSGLMAKIRGKDTKPEMTVRRLIHHMGYRYRLHARDLPGRPDIVFRIRRKVILVHGCFWHQHQGCVDASMPKTNVDFWKAKLRRNVERDIEQEQELQNLGWKALTIWECDLKDDQLPARISRFLDK